MTQCDIVQIDGQEYVEAQDQRYGLGLHLPTGRPSFSTLASKDGIESLTMERAREIVESADFAFSGERWGPEHTKDQNGYGSCAGYGVAGAEEKDRESAGQERVVLSGDYAYSRVNDGRDRGSGLDENMRSVLTNGIATAATVPRGKIYRSSYNTAVADREALRFRALECYTTPDEQSLVTALVLGMFPVIAIHVGRNWRRFDSDGVLIGDNGVGNHCEHLCGIRYSRKHGRFEFRKASSHSVSYGEGGYCWIHAGHLRTPWRYHDMYTIGSVRQDPEGDNPTIGGNQDENPEPLATPVLTVESSEGCKWCRDWNRTERPKVQAAGYHIQKGNVPGNTGIPAFMLSIGERSVTHQGFWGFAEIEQAIAGLR